MHTVFFSASTLLDATPTVVFAFHENPDNLRAIAPGSLRLQKITCEPVARTGDFFRIEASQFGLPIRWLGRWVRVESPGLLMDEAVESPFVFFQHRHEFVAGDGGTIMTDRVEYALPGGWAGWLIAATLGRVALSVMFRSRHTATRRYFRGLLKN